MNCLDANFAAQKGQKVILIDQQAEPGGAWTSIQVGEYGKLELGCHIWSYNKKVYQFLEDQLALNLINLSPQPYLTNGKWKVTYDRKNAAITIKHLFSLLKRLQFKAILEFISQNPSARIPIFAKTYKYPAGGSREFQERLNQTITNSGITFKGETQVNSIQYKNKLWSCELNNEKKIIGKNIQLTSCSNLDSLIFEDKKITIPTDPVSFTHYHIVYKKQCLKPVSYIRIMNDKYIHRISDITYQLENSATNHTILLVGVFEDALKKDGVEADNIHPINDRLIDLGYIDKDNEILYHQKNTYQTSHIPTATRDEINALDPSIQLVRSTDLIYGIRYQMRKWKKEKTI